ncbi:dipeptide transport ATP-binding protein DppF [Sulfurihydrogenibium azorense Az-Fu1]|uniref:Dipeptide transport ATP-binding protein DppF n=1 Tax=Sulfurihydrogenibium azorense (strain DSM 15241 / OCM 825 / Az-Fu1) TaxID=204536 RepID=C1DVN1_SULAA|nr:oligopeptide/dipeptide ABC transporter ATP-binding protein [Sulfurihydrogenibium azorense]ACN98943.1 dipeptide transport ATP-binding protein DppF [Sulfurihydrogenibium azorense Az-Fu1]
MDSSRQLLQAENLTKRYVVKSSLFKKEYFQALSEVSFSVEKNQIVGLVGESGSGKSTVGKIILNLIKADSGKVYLLGKDITNNLSKEDRKKISIIFQDPRTSLNPRFKIKDILEEPLIVHKYPKSDRKDSVLKTIKSVGLDETFLDRYPHELSGGQRQRVAIARAIILDPILVVADEPTSALDVSVQLQIIQLIKQLKEEKGISFIFISHDLNIVGHIADYIVVLYKGKIVEKGNKEEVIKNPLHPYTKLLLESLPPSHPKYRKPFVNVKEDINTYEGCEFIGNGKIK